MTAGEYLIKHGIVIWLI